MSYVTIDIKVTPDSREPDSYLATASTYGRDRRTETESFSLSKEAWLSVEPSLIALKARDEARGATTHDHTEKIRGFGRLLFRSLINGEIRRLYDDKKREAAKNRRPLRLRLTLVPFELVILPWELLCDDRDNEYLCLAKNPPIILIRSTDNARVLRLHSSDSSKNHTPLRILGMISNPEDQGKLQGKDEKKNIENILQSMIEDNRISLIWTETGKYEDLSRFQHDEDGWHIFHFIGHGRFGEVHSSSGEKHPQGQLIFEDENYKSKHITSKYVPAQKFRLVLHSNIHLVVLNACETARGESSDPFSSIAHSLAKDGIPAVVAMQFRILDKASLRFAETFYTLLEKGAFLEEAIAEARRNIYSTTDGEENLDWAAPILYVSSLNSISLRNISLRSFARPKGPRSPKASHSIGERTGELAGSSNPEAKTKKLDQLEEKTPILSVDPDRSGKQPYSPGPIPIVPLPPPPTGPLSRITGKRLSRRGWTWTGVIMLLLTALLIFILIYPRLFSVSTPLPTAFCIATDFSTMSEVVGGDNSGAPFVNGAELAIQENTNLGSGYTLQPNCADENDNNPSGKSDPTVGFQNLQRVIANPQVLGMVGPGSSDIAQRDLLTAAQNDFPIVSPNTTNPCLTLPTQCSNQSINLQELTNPYARICANDNTQGEFDADFLARTLHLSTIYVVNDGSVYGQGLANAFQSYFTGTDGKTVIKNSLISSNLSNEQIAQLAQQIVSQKSSGVFYGGRESSGIVSLKIHLVQDGFTGVLMSGDGVALDDQYISDAGQAAFNTYATGLDPVIAKTNSFYALYQKSFGSATDSVVSQAAGGYDAAMVLIRAIQHVLQNDPSAFHSNVKTLREAVLQEVQFNTIAYQGLTGTISLRNGENAAATTMQVYTITNGQWVPYNSN